MGLGKSTRDALDTVVKSEDQIEDEAWDMNEKIDQMGGGR